MGFTKLDEGILQSSIIGESGDVFKVWIALLASCKEDGIARLSPIFLASVCRLDINIVIDALNKLMSPDPFSRSKEEEGRRLKEVEGGYWVVNYKKYRDRTYSGSKAAIKKRTQREATKEEYSESFILFWNNYPRKVAKQDAWKAWQTESPQIETVLKALSWQKLTEQWNKSNGQFIPHPTTYLNQGRWKDEPQKVNKPIVAEMFDDPGECQ